MERIELDISAFLPAYSGIDTTKNDELFAFYPNRIPANIQQEFYPSTFLKREFNILKSPAIEPPRIPGAPFKPLSSQTFVARFMSGYTPYDRLIVFWAVGSGKCFRKGTKVIMASGHIKNVEDICIGDKLMGDDSRERTVLALGRGREQMYKITQDGGEPYEVNESHIISLKVINQKSITEEEMSGIKHISAHYFDTAFNKRETRHFMVSNNNETECKIRAQKWLDQYLDVSHVDMELRKYMTLNKNTKRYYKGYRVGVEWPEQSLLLDPYFLGLYLGNNGNEHIPHDYKANSKINRLKLLAGIIDSTGSFDVINKNYNIHLYSSSLIDDIIFIIRSLGFRSQKSEIINNDLQSVGGSTDNIIYKIIISGNNLYEIPVLQIPERKILEAETYDPNSLCGDIKIEPIGIDDYYGFVIDSNHRFLLEDFTVSHNTCLFSLLSEMIQDENPNMRETLVLTRSEVLQTNAKNEIAKVCTQGKYLPSRWDEKKKKVITDETYVKRLNKAISARYLFNTWERMAKTLAADDDDTIKELYSDRCIVIDESHGLKQQSKEQEISIYKQIHRLLHLVRNCKILLLTATPIRDRPYEIAPLLNLILSPDQQINPETFMDTYFDGIEFKPSMKAVFKSKIRGLISYVREQNSNVKRIYEGSIVSSYMNGIGMRKVPLEVAIMSNHQSKYYEIAYNKDRNIAPVESLNEDDEPNEEETEGKAGLYKNSRQASLFIAPDGTYGIDLEKKWLVLSKEDRERREHAKLWKQMTPEEKEADKIARAKAKRAEKNLDEKEESKELWEELGITKPKIKSSIKAKVAEITKLKRPVKSLKDKLTSVSADLRAAIYGDGKIDPGIDIKLENLSIFSSKYAGVIRQLIKYPTEKAFVYCDLVLGSGCNLFAALLELFGFEHVSLPTSTGSPPDLEKYRVKDGEPRKFILITAKFPTNIQASYLINQVYNDPVNKYGDLIQVIVASRIVSEGISFKATRQFHNMTPWWNETQTTQAEGRVIRAFAHDIFTDPDEKFVKIFRWCSMSRNKNFPSIDFEMYKLSEDKDYPIKQVERLLKEAAVDCGLNAARNMRPGIDQDGSRACDYQKCVYKCDDLPASWYMPGEAGPDKPLIDDTYNLYYAREQIDDIKSEIRQLFRTRFAYDLFELQPIFRSAPILVLLRALKEIIDQSMPILNKYGIMSYLQESQNLYFLVDNYEFRQTANLYLLAEYNAMPIIKEEMSFQDYTRMTEYKYIPEKLEILQELSQNEDIVDLSSEISLTLRSLDVRTQEAIIESSIKAEHENIDQNVRLRSAILQTYQDAIVSVDKSGKSQKNTNQISSLLKEDYGILRCYDAKMNDWIDCPSDMEKVYSNTIAKRKAKLKANPYGYYGVFDSKAEKGKSFKVATVFKGRLAASTGKADKRYEREGREGLTCGTGKLSAKRLIDFMLKLGDIAEEQEPQDPTPDIRPILGSNALKMIDKSATPENVYKLWLDVLDSSKTINPNRLDIDATEREITELEEEKEAGKLSKSQDKKLAGLISSLREEQNRLKIMRKKISKFNNDKLKRWYALLVFGDNAKKILCPALQEWFSQIGLLERR